MPLVTAVACEVPDMMNSDWSHTDITILSRDTRAILRVEGDAARLQEVELRGCAACIQRAVRAFDLIAAPLHDQGERQHSTAADAAEEVGSRV